jgi:2-polyprenyl-3-methyl-5-hydroxy-6-metoxy-1,4-benzoquinol methylase
VIRENLKIGAGNVRISLWNFGTKKPSIELRGGVVLDIGSGDGLLLSELKKRGISAEGVDVSESGVQKSIARGLKVYLGDVTSLHEIKELQGRKFPVITILEVLEHLFNPEDTLAGVRKLIADDGVLYLSVPNFNAPLDRIRMLFGHTPFHNKPGKGHVYWMNKERFEKLIRRAGFEIIEFRGLGYRERGWLAPLGEILANTWPSLFALSFFVCAKPKKRF